MFAARQIAILVCACLSAGTSGCIHASRWAEDARGRVALGMTENQVRNEIGDPAQIVRGDPGQPIYWIYRFESAPTAVTIIVATVFIVGLLVLIALISAKGNGGSLDLWSGWGDDDLAEFRVHFNEKDCVVEISPIVVRPKE